MKIKLDTGEIFIVTEEKRLELGPRAGIPPNMIRQGIADGKYEIVYEE